MTAGVFLKGIISKVNFTSQSFLTVALLLWTSQIGSLFLLHRNHSQFAFDRFYFSAFNFFY